MTLDIEKQLPSQVGEYTDRPEADPSLARRSRLGFFSFIKHERNISDEARPPLPRTPYPFGGFSQPRVRRQEPPAGSSMPKLWSPKPMRHPADFTHILGIGKEHWDVLDISCNPTSPATRLAADPDRDSHDPLAPRALVEQIFPAALSEGSMAETRVTAFDLEVMFIAKLLERGWSIEAADRAFDMFRSCSDRRFPLHETWSSGDEEAEDEDKDNVEDEEKEIEHELSSERDYSETTFDSTSPDDDSDDFALLMPNPFLSDDEYPHWGAFLRSLPNY